MNLKIVVLVASLCIQVCALNSVCAVQKSRSFYYGTWVDSALYNEMHRTRSPYSTRGYVRNQAILHSLPEGTRYFGWSDGLDYIDSAFVDNVLILKDPGDENNLLELKIVDDSTLTCNHFFGATTVVFRRMVPTPPPDNRPLDWFFDQKYFKGMKKILTVATNTIGTATFSDSGNIIGSPELRYYGTIIGGWEGLPSYDILWLTTQDDSLHCLNYELEGDTILVYELLWKDKSGETLKATGDWEESDVFRGALKYKITAAK